MTDLDKFIEAFIEAMCWTNEHELGEAELSDEIRLDIAADCRSFWRRFGCYVEPSHQDPQQAGHDFWLTRNGHGAGFWDGDWPEPYAEMLTKASESYGPFEPYVGDDGLIYV